MQMIASDRKIIVIGLGATGLACARFLTSKGQSFSVCDTRTAPSGLDAFKAEFPLVNVHLGELDADYLSSASEIIVSPGVALSSPAIAQAKEKGVLVRGDVDVFVEHANAPIAAITGSNGKSTVTTLLGDMAKQANKKVAVGGNLGTPALDLLADDVELYILELSSFQLEGISKLGAKCATVLNVSEDHMDRYDSKLSYLQAKQRVFIGAKHVVVNDDDPLTQPLLSDDMTVWRYGLNGLDLKKFALNHERQGDFLVRGFDTLVSSDELNIKGSHNISNALCALAMGSALGLSMQAMLDALKSFRGLAHRCEFVREHGGVLYINDSKGTNTGASSTAINSLGETIKGKVVVIAGGESKDADMSVLKPALQKHASHLVLIGADAQKIADAVDGSTPIQFADSMADAVQKASAFAQSGDVVLLSPACASFDMYANFEARGVDFCEEVAKL